ncbi:hypothetical protein [Streptosporangium lutulentum]|uniref:Uncharacterized protein n=1 Tax=Streptosporangium lutulentum TaxID=1461250 RepID=A0ABT9QNC2_9ACTN|nr:hypothetical protein [Streptosporangium lutulentum]MDP9848227.1 hypothetical protein [Streptosporangium lutulentum]
MKIRLVPYGDIELRCGAVMKRVVLFRGVPVTVGIPVKKLSVAIPGSAAGLFILADKAPQQGLRGKVEEPGGLEPGATLVFRT